MASAWQTLEEAALTLGLSSRTLHRRLAKGEFETRLENGRREVLVVVNETEVDVTGFATPRAADSAAEQEMPVTDTPCDTSDIADMSDVGDSATNELSDEIQTTMLALHEDRIRRTDLAIMAYQQSVNVTAADARRAHRKARVAWGLAGTAVAGMFVAVVWATHSITRANAQVDHLNSVVRQLSDTADTRGREVERLRKDSQDAQVAAARMDGELAATREAANQSAKRQAEAQVAAARTGAATSQPATPATQPVSVMQNLMDRVTIR